MTKTKEPIRKTVYLEEQLVSCAETLFKQAEVDSFSAFVKKAIEAYISKLIFSKNSDILSKEIRKAIREEIYPTNLRLSKGLYKYAIELDLLAQMVAYRTDYEYGEIDWMRNEARKHVAQNRGMVDVDAIINRINEEENDD